MKAAKRPAAAEDACAPVVQARLIAAALTAKRIDLASFLCNNIVKSSRRNPTKNSPKHPMCAAYRRQWLALRTMRQPPPGEPASDTATAIAWSVPSKRYARVRAAGPTAYVAT